MFLIELALSGSHQKPTACHLPGSFKTVSDVCFNNYQHEFIMSRGTNLSRTLEVDQFNNKKTGREALRLNSFEEHLTEI